MKVKPLFVLAIIVLGALLLVGVDEASASSLTASLALLSLPSGAVVQVKQGCKVVDGQRICGKKKGNAGNDDDNNNNNRGKKKGNANNNKNNNNNNNSNNNNEKQKNNAETGNPCGPGYVVLKEKNEYGNFCQPTEPVRPNCAPGTVLNGDQCNCPPGTVPNNGINSVQSVSECHKRAKDCLNIVQSQAENYRVSCFTLHNATASCSAAAGDLVHCCCEYDSK
jgi:hypothetical protein